MSPHAVSVPRAPSAPREVRVSADDPAPADDPSKIPFTDYDPPSTLVVPQHPVERARYPFVDVHSHQFGLDEAKVLEVVDAMDRMNLAVLVNLSGRGFRRVPLPDGSTRFGLQDPETLRELVALTERVAPGRIVHFTNVDFWGVGSPDWAARGQ